MIPLGFFPTFLLTWIGFILLLPLIAPVFALTFLYKWAIVFLSGIFKGDLLIEPISGLDLSFRLDDFWTRPKGATSFIWIGDGEIEGQVIEDRLKKIILCGGNHNDSYNYQKLTSLYPEFWMGFPFWAKTTEQFHIKNHLHIPSINHLLKEGAIQREGDNCVRFDSKEDLNGFLCSWMREGFRKGLPLWEVMLIPKVILGKDSEDVKSVFVLKIHHVIGDGYSKLRLLEKIVDKPSLSNTSHCIQGNCKKSFLKNFQEVLQNLVFLPPTIWSLVRDFGLHNDYFTKRKETSEVVLGSTIISMDKLKLIRKKVKGHFTFFDGASCEVPLIVIAASLFAGCIRRFLEAQNNAAGMAKGQGVKGHYVCKSTNFVLALPLKGGHPGDFQFCNHWTHGILQVEIDEKNALRRLLKLNKNYTKCLNERWPLVYHSLIVPAQSLLPKFVWKKLTDFNMGAPIGTTNMIGPKEKVFLGGREIQEKYAYVGLLWKHSSMTGAFFSYNGNISATLVANKDIIPDEQVAAKVINQYFHTELQQLLHILEK